MYLRNLIDGSFKLVNVENFPEWIVPTIHHFGVLNVVQLSRSNVVLQMLADLKYMYNISESVCILLGFMLLSSILQSYHDVGHIMRKPVLCHMPTIKMQPCRLISILVVCSLNTTSKDSIYTLVYIKILIQS